MYKLIGKSVCYVEDRLTQMVIGPQWSKAVQLEGCCYVKKNNNKTVIWINVVAVKMRSGQIQVEAMGHDYGLK